MAEHVLLIPGLLCSPRLFAAQAAALRRAGHAVTIPPTAVAPDIAAVAESVLATAPPHFALAGFSFGGYVALEVARQAEAGRVTRLALLSSQARPDTPQQTARRRAQVAQARASGSLEGVLRAQLPNLLHPSHLPPQWEARVAELCAAAGGAPPAAAAVVGAPPRAPPLDVCVAMAADVGVEGFALQQEACISRRDGQDTLLALAARGVPLMLLLGREDALIPARASVALFDAAVAASAGRARSHGDGAHAHHSRTHHHAPVLLRELAPGVGHMTPLERPDDVSQALLEWLRLG